VPSTREAADCEQRERVRSYSVEKKRRTGEAPVLHEESKIQI